MSSRRRKAWSDEELAQLCNRYPNERAATIANDLGRPVSHIYAKANELGICKSHAFLSGPESGRANVTRNRKGAWTAEQLAILHARYPHEKTSTLAAAIGRSVTSLYTRAARDGLKKTPAFLASEDSGRTEGKRGLSSRFQPGHQPANKGLRRPGYSPGRMSETQFKKGQSNCELPIGSFRQTTKERHWRKKVKNDGRPQDRWVPLHKLVWIEHHGPIPPGHVVRFIDGNPGETPQDVTIDRLECISKAENMRRNTIHNLPKPMVEVLQQKARLTREINKQTRARDEEHD